MVVSVGLLSQKQAGDVWLCRSEMFVGTETEKEKERSRASRFRLPRREEYWVVRPCDGSKKEKKKKEETILAGRGSSGAEVQGPVVAARGEVSVDLRPVWERAELLQITAPCIKVYLEGLRTVRSKTTSRKGIG